MPNPVTILLVADNSDDEALTVQALRIGTTANVEVACDGQEALDYLFPRSAAPQVVPSAQPEERSPAGRRVARVRSQLARGPPAPA